MLVQDLSDDELFSVFVALNDEYINLIKSKEPPDSVVDPHYKDISERLKSLIEELRRRRKSTPYLDV